MEKVTNNKKNLEESQIKSFEKISQIKSFKIKSLAERSLKKLCFPPSLEELQERWCGMNEMLNEIVISPDNQNFKFTDEYKINSIPKLECLEDKPKMIVSKSDNQNFDTVIFASRNIEEAAIPSDLLFIEISPDNNNFKFADFEEKLIMEKVTKTKKNLIFLLLYVVTFLRL